MAVLTRFSDQVEENVKTGENARAPGNAEVSTVSRQIVMARPGKAAFMEE
jgi:hypothetical protein